MAFSFTSLPRPLLSSFPRAHPIRSALVGARLPSPRLNTTTTPLSQTRTMASSPALTEWLIVVPDKPGTLAKRLEVRPTHFADLNKVIESGKLKFGGAVLDDAPADPNDPKTFAFAGSTLILLAKSKAEVIEHIKKDIYTKEGVWDVDNAQVWALKTAHRVP